MSGGMTSAEKTLRLSDAVRALTKVAKAAEVRCECTDICAAQIRGARAMLNLTQEELARKAGVSIMAIKNLESQKRKPRKKTLSRVVKALDDDGITFLEHGILLKELTYGRRN